MPDDVLDRAALENLLDSVGGDQEFLVELIDTYFADSPGLLATLRQSAQDGKADELRRAAHSLKSNSASFGALTLSGLCKALEEIGRSGSVAGAAERLPEVEAEYERARAALLALRETGV